MANGFKVDNASGAPGINIWSRGPIYPLVIARKERYVSYASFDAPNIPIIARDGVYWDVLNADDEMSGFASYDDALEAAKGWLENKAVDEFCMKPVLSPFNPTAFDAELADDLIEDELNRDLRADAVAAAGGA